MVCWGEAVENCEQTKNRCMRKRRRCPTLRLPMDKHSRIDVQRQRCNSKAKIGRDKSIGSVELEMQRAGRTAEPTSRCKACSRYGMSGWT